MVFLTMTSYSRSFACVFVISFGAWSTSIERPHAKTGVETTNLNPTMGLSAMLLSHISDKSAARQLSYGVLVGVALSLATSSLLQYYNRKKRENTLLSSFDSRPIELRSDEVVDGVVGLIGVSSCSPLLYCPSHTKPIQETRLSSGSTP